MQRAGVKYVSRGDLHHAAKAHHHDLMADMAHHGKVVRDEDQSQTDLILQIHQQVDDLRLNGHVQGRDRFIADDQLGRADDRTGDADTLGLPAGEFVGVALREIGGQADQAQGFYGAGVQFGTGQTGFKDGQRTRDDAAKRHAPVKGGDRVLKNDLQFRPPAAQGVGGHRSHILTLPQHGAGGRFDQPQHGAAQGGFATAAFANHAQGATGVQRQIGVMDDGQDAGAGENAHAGNGIADLQMPRFQQCHGAPVRWQAAWRLGAMGKRGGWVVSQTAIFTRWRMARENSCG